VKPRPLSTELGAVCPLFTYVGLGINCIVAFEGHG